ncbi:MAG: UvrABC system protein A [candidate division WS6 bacterium GW2011_GWB1_33_6]|uniref:UvrABC system protein A n=1 Tax=candidate division WS6 bacterium GW2011_GWB1_33_6 TaxID=1619088 RepID=A0A0G0AE48_9BACT|nr:MAG: UvrABC system protein A [candidate division WS6 bacterium GW2011_GWB1_33_6]
MNEEYIKIRGAKEHNLKNISLDIPKNKLVVLTGVSGSGKSSLAFDTLYAEGQRRYVESLSSYARQFLGLMHKPDVDSITGLSPAISIDQKTTSSNPRSTVGTITEIYGYLRLLFGHIGQAYCPKCGSPITSQSLQQISEQITKLIKEEDTKFQILSPLVKGRKGDYKALLSKLLNRGFSRIIIDGNMYHLDDVEDLKLDSNIKHTIDLIVDRLDSEMLKESKESFQKRLIDSLELASSLSDGEVKVLIGDKEYFFSEKNTCFNCQISYPKITPASFSFNAPEGACSKCSGLGIINEIDLSKIYNPNLTILEGGIFPWSNRTTKDSWIKRILESVAKEHNFDLQTPISKYSKEIFDLIFYASGVKESYKIQYTNRFGRERVYDVQYEGVIKELERLYQETDSEFRRADIEKYMTEKVCDSCNGNRLKPYSLGVKIGNYNIIEITDLPIDILRRYITTVPLEGNKKVIAKPIVKEINSRLEFLVNVGLSYITLSRKANTLSGGESQRIRLASQIGTGLSGVLYVLDEPSIGLHPRDVDKLLTSIESLRDTGNSVVVVEHDEETMERADWIIDIGPYAGEHGGEVIAEGKLEDIKNSNSLTSKYLSNKLRVGEHIEQTLDFDFNSNEKLSISNVSTHNLKNVTLNIPLNTLTCITGVSGSGKSSLINDTLYPALMNKKMHGKQIEGTYSNINGLEYIDKVIGIDQKPIGKTPRSNPATYTGLFTYIRDLFSQTQEARSRGYKSGRFSFNVKGGRCEKCKGEGEIKVEMQFLPDMYITCDECNGKRYNDEALSIDYKDKNISEILDLTVEQALEVFKDIPSLKNKLEILQEVGLGYIKLGQSALTLSGGESQRIKLAKELSKQTRGHTVYILDEPTTGLHFYDIDKLLTLLKKLVSKGSTVIVTEHNLDVIKFADWIVDLGPEGGDGGGRIIAEGTVSEIIKNEKSSTGEWLKKRIEQTDRKLK